MSRFPFFKEIAEQRALIVGGGEVALRRARMLRDFGANVVCIAPEFCEGFSGLDIECIQRRLEVGDVCGWDIVIAATENRGLNASIVKLARAQGSEANTADDPELSTFLFPGIVRRGGITVAVSSNGSSPSATKYVRERIEESIPENFEDVLKSMELARAAVKEMITEQKTRALVLRKIFDLCLQAHVQPDDAAIKDMIRCIQRTELD